ncbi:AfsR/SARP family transcriptional regulator [Nonomuraea glycinis]|uniref:AfsR/SARP family transcriptional regulator n=1 Tax=Nonomuraea glycinis TaxID=2047744 RepID=UPI0033AED18C
MANTRSVTGPLVGASLFGLLVMAMSAVVMRQRRVRVGPAVAVDDLLAGGDAGHGRTSGSEKGTIAAGTPQPTSSAPSGDAVLPGADEKALAPLGENGAEEVAEQAAAGTAASTLLASTFVAGPGRAKGEVLGPVRLSLAGNALSFGRAEAWDLFALLSTSKDGVLSKNLVETLWPEDRERSARRLESAIRDINRVMRAATGLSADVRFVVKAEQRRRLSAAYFDVDFWRFEDAYVQASTATEESVRLSALREMVGLYQGPLLAQRDDLWCLPLRQAAQRQAVNAAERLAEVERKSDPDRALDVLRLAVDRIDAYSEVLWCLIMTIQGELGRVPAVRRSFEQLTERLAEIDARPSTEARRTYERFIA